MQDLSGWQQFLQLTEKASKSKQLDELLVFLLTDEEQEQLATRVQLVQALLEKKQSQREIAKDLKISISKITRGSNGLKHINEKLKQFLSKNLIK